VLQDLRAIQRWPLWIRLALMCVALGVAYLLQIPLERDWPGEPFLLFVLVVIGTTLCFGTRVGLISAALSVFLSLYFFEPVGSPALRYASDLNKIALYAIIALGCVVGFAFAEFRTEQIEAQRVIAESEARFRAAFENAAVGVVLVDPKGSLLRVNDTFAGMLGYSTEELQTKTFEDITPPDDLADNVSVWEKTLTGKANSYRIEKRYVRKDGGFIWASLTVGCVRKADGAVDYFLSVIEDIADRKLAEVSLAERNAELVTERRRTEQVNRQLELAAKHALVGTYALEIDGGRKISACSACSFRRGLPPSMASPRRQWRSRSGIGVP
jgi:PAS domain S-box-containing protein